STPGRPDVEKDHLTLKWREGCRTVLEIEESPVIAGRFAGPRALQRGRGWPGTEVDQVKRPEKGKEDGDRQPRAHRAILRGAHERRYSIGALATRLGDGGEQVLYWCIIVGQNDTFRAVVHDGVVISLAVRLGRRVPAPRREVAGVVLAKSQVL